MEDEKSAWCLIRQGNATRQTNFQLKYGVTIIGKIMEADIILFSKYMSKLHCEIIVDNTSVRIKDLNTLCGTYVNDIQLRNVEAEVKENFTIGFGVKINENISINDPEIFIYRLEKKKEIIEISDDDCQLDNVLDGIKQSVKLMQSRSVKENSVVRVSNLEKDKSRKLPKRRLSKAEDRFYSNSQKRRRIEETKEIQRKLSLIVDPDSDVEIYKRSSQNQHTRSETKKKHVQIIRNNENVKTVISKTNVKQSTKIEEIRKNQRRLSKSVDPDLDDEIDGRYGSQNHSNEKVETVTRAKIQKLPDPDSDNEGNKKYGTRSQTARTETKQNCVLIHNGRKSEESEKFEQVKKKFDVLVKLTDNVAKCDKTRKIQRRFTIAEDPVYNLKSPINNSSIFFEKGKCAKNGSILKETKKNDLGQKKNFQLTRLDTEIRETSKAAVAKRNNSTDTRPKIEVSSQKPKSPEKKNYDDSAESKSNSTKEIPKKPMRRKSMSSVTETIHKSITKITTIHTVTTKFKDVELISLRREKLRELAIKQKQEKLRIQNNLIQHLNNTAKIKITENNRMDKMLNDIKSQSNNVCLAGKITKRRNTVAVIDNTPVPFICKSEVPEPIIEKVTEVEEPKAIPQPQPMKTMKMSENPPSVAPRSTCTIRRRNTIALDSDDLNKEISFASMNTVRIADSSTNNQDNLLKSCLKKPCVMKKRGVQFNDNLVETKIIHCSTDQEIVELIAKDPETCLDKSSSLEISEAFLREILSWDPDDFMNFIKFDQFPKIKGCSKNTPSLVSSSFDDFGEYKRFLIPQLKFEMWASILNMYESVNQQDCNYLMVEKISQRRNSIVIGTSIKQNQCKNFNLGNLVLVSYKNDFKNFTKSSFTMCFGYIVFEQFQPDIYKTVLEIQIHNDQRVLKNEGKLVFIKVVPLGYIRNTAKSVDAIQRLQPTKLVKLVINPELVKPIINLDIEYSGMNFDCHQKNILSKVITDCINNFNTPNILAIEGGSGTGKTEILVSAVSDIFKYGFKMFNRRFKFLICTVSYSCINRITAALLKKKRTDSFCDYNLFQLDGIREKSIQEADILCVTFDRINRIFELERKFDFCLVDEASKATDWQMIVPLAFDLTKIVLFGDSRQSPSTLGSKTFKQEAASSLFRRIVNANKGAVLKINYQYRMHPHILKFLNFYFYRNELKTLVNQIPMQVLMPYAVFELHSGHQSNVCPSNIEINFALKIINKILVKYGFSVYKNILGDYTYGIFTSNNQQKNELIKILSKSNGQCKLNISVHNMDSLEGAEFDVVIICLTDSTTNSISAMTNNPQVALTALTRAKRSLYICGNLFSLKSNKLWFNLIQDALRRGCFYNGFNEGALNWITN